MNHQLKRYPTNDLVLLICDIDGVLLDARHRDHLMPPSELMDHNDHWLAHQQAINDTPDPVLHLNCHVVKALAITHPLVLLTGRMELARPGTLRDVMDFCRLSPDGLWMRPNDCHLPPGQFKAETISHILSGSVAEDVQCVIFIDNAKSNIEAVKQAYQAGKYGRVEMHFLQLTPEGYL